MSADAAAGRRTPASSVSATPATRCATCPPACEPVEVYARGMCRPCYTFLVRRGLRDAPLRLRIETVASRRRHRGPPRVVCRHCRRDFVRPTSRPQTFCSVACARLHDYAHGRHRAPRQALAKKIKAKCRPWDIISIGATPPLRVARMFVDEGRTMGAIARLEGVSTQRISSILHRLADRGPRRK